MSGAKYKLTSIAIAAAKTPGFYADGAGLFLQVTKGTDGTPRRSWLVRYRIPGGKVRGMGVGSAELIGLPEARRRAEEARKLAATGIDPLDDRAAKRGAELADAAIEKARAKTFRQCAEDFMLSRQAKWKNPKHRQQWASTLATYAYPSFGNLPVQAVNGAMVIQVLKPIWNLKPETASRLRGRIETILNYATACGYRSGDNPAQWRGHLDYVFPARNEIRKVKHHAALPYGELPSFMGVLRAQEGMAARALEFAILTTTRTSETLNARWPEIDLERSLWTIPADRMKAGTEHRVPLSPQAVEMLNGLKSKAQLSEWVFPGASPGRPLSNMAMLMVLRRMKRGDLTAHGFRSTFRDWAAEQTNYPREVAEAALAHTNGNKVEAAYFRSDLFDKRSRLMNEWAKYCTSPVTKSANKIVKLHKR